MKQLEAVLRGKDGTAMWEALDRMKLSPNDKVVIHKKINNSGTIRVRCDIIVPNFWLSPVLQMFILYRHSYSHASVNLTCVCTKMCLMYASTDVYCTPMAIMVLAYFF